MAFNPFQQDEYYVAPPDHVFAGVKRAAIALWRTFDDTYGYASGKVARIADIENVRDNCGYIVAMFDAGNMRRLLDKADDPDAAAFIQRCIDTQTAALIGLFDGSDD